MEEVQIIRVEAVEGAAIQKNQMLKTFFAPITYVLEDGRTISSHYYDSRKKDVKAYLDNLPEQPKGMKAMFREGEFWGTQQSLSGIMGW